MSRKMTLENEHFNVLTMKTNIIKQFVNLLKWLRKEKRKGVELSNFSLPNQHEVHHTETNFENKNEDLFYRRLVHRDFFPFPLSINER